jgi:hypothetical protein
MIRYHILGQQGFRQVKLVRESSEAAVQTVRYLLDYGWQVTITSKLVGMKASIKEIRS